MEQLTLKKKKIIWEGQKEVFMSGRRKGPWTPSGVHRQLERLLKLSCVVGQGGSIGGHEVLGLKGPSGVAPACPV